VVLLFDFLVFLVVLVFVVVFVVVVVLVVLVFEKIIVAREIHPMLPAVFARETVLGSFHRPFHQHECLKTIEAWLASAHGTPPEEAGTVPSLAKRRTHQLAQASVTHLMIIRTPQSFVFAFRSGELDPETHRATIHVAPWR
tara:strand:- start:152 stop:574 length:423 start_codon:yes stop_codon:yes gene_type:complete